MGTVTEAIVRNCLIYHGSGGDCEIRQDCGDLLITFPGGIVRRSRRGAFGDLYVPIDANGAEARLDLGSLLAA